MIWWPEPEPNGVEAQGIQKDKNFCLPYCLPHQTIKTGSVDPAVAFIN
nr:MAG TPA: hypothetical protein [Caudoviricetes sp.]